MEGLFWVNDPSNDYENADFSLYMNNGVFPYNHEKRDGFNDLERRKMDLCNLADGCCDKFCDDNLLMDALKEVTFIPLPAHGH